MNRAFRDHIEVKESSGTVMVIEKEFGPQGARDWASVAGPFADIVKTTFGTAALYEEIVGTPLAKRLPSNSILYVLGIIKSSVNVATS